MQDTTTSAMTEVALGLSMAFFTLLIVSLLSMSLPASKENVLNELSEDMEKKSAINIQMQSKSKDDSKSSTQFAFYFNGKFYDKSLAIRPIDSFSKAQNLTIAVNPNLTFAEVFTLRQRVMHPKLSITASNKTWSSRLQQMTALD